MFSSYLIKQLKIHDLNKKFNFESIIFADVKNKDENVTK